MSNKGRETRRRTAPAALYRADIDGLRAVAIFGVLAYHFGLGVPGGYGGVDVFFVISGFLIAGIIRSELEAGTFSLAQFYVRRIRRILPALTVCVVVVTIFAAYILFPPDFILFSKSVFAVATSTSNFYFMAGTGYFDGPALSKPLLHTWSLSVEEQFYAVFPLLLLLISKAHRTFVAPILIVIALASLAFSFREVQVHPQTAFFSTPARIWELLIGAILAMSVIPNLKSRTLREGEAVLGGLMIALPFFLYNEATEFPGLTALPLCLGAALLIHSGNEGSLSPTVVARCLSSPPVVALGLISYSVYLWHWPLAVLFQYRFPELWHADGVQGIEVRLILALISVGLGALSWRFVEQPFRHMRRLPRRPIFASAGVAIVALSVLSYAASRKPEWFQHWSPEVRAETAFMVAKSENKCVPQKNTVGATSRVCRLGTAVPVDTLLWGDSHARRIMAGLAATDGYEGHSVLVQTFGGCPPLVGATLYGRSRSVKCPFFNDSVLARASARDIKRVILAARWAMYAEGTRDDDNGGAPIYLSEEGVVKNPEIFAARLEATVKSLTARGIEVAIVGPVPENEFDAPMALARSMAWKQPLPAETTLSRFVDRERHVLPVLARLDALPHVHVVYPHLILCDDTSCRYGKDGRSLYRDTNHLNPIGLAEIGSLFPRLFVKDGEDANSRDSAFSSSYLASMAP